MEQFNIYKLHFTAPVHFGDRRSDYDISLKTIYSDTMYAAIISCLAKLGLEIPVNGDIGCTISSLFPFYQKDGCSDATYFLPKPIGTISPVDRASAKKLKRIGWLDIAYFQKLISGQLDGAKITMDSIKGKEYLTNDDIADDFVSSQVTTRVNVSRTGGEDASPFYMDRVYFKDHSGLYFIVEGNTELLEKGLKLLQYEGIGTDRNVGNGYFTYEKVENAFELDFPLDCKKMVSLSIFIPESTEHLKDMLAEDCSYEIVRRGGWITTSPYNTYRKNTIYAFMHGSVFPVSGENSGIKGKIVDLTPKSVEIGHSIWRNGKSMFIPANI